MGETSRMTTEGIRPATGTFGPYELEALRGEDAVSRQYRARDRLRSRIVTLRVFSAGAVTTARMKAWKALERLKNPRIVPVHVSGQLDGRLFLDTEWTDDPDLASLVGAADPLPADRIWPIALDVAAALDAAAAAGVFHGLVRPESVMVGSSGARLTDFAVTPGVAPDGRRADLAGLGRLIAATAAGVDRATLATAVATATGPTAAVDLVQRARGPLTRTGSPEAWSPWPVPLRPPAARAASPGIPSTSRPQPAPSMPAPRRASDPQPMWWHGRQTSQHATAVPVIRVGRAARNDVVIDDLLVSHEHAELRRDGDGWRIRDLHSWNGTFLNGARVSEAGVAEYDVIGIGHTLLRLVGDRLVEYTDSGDITFVARDLQVRTRQGRVLLDGVGFALRERSLLAVIGPSGAGKSTLLRALTGFQPATSGTVEYAGRDLYADYDELRQRIGLVPQDDVLHVQLPVRRALLYAAELRFPAEATKEERERRVDEVMRRLGLDERVAEQRIATLSGGQRKRVSVALELLTRPSLLFLDEPTSGLDPGMRKEVMETLRELADEGRTVVTVTHDEGSLDVCDRLLVLAKGGKVAFFGPPAEALDYFGKAEFADVFQLLNNDETTDWAARYAASPHAARHLAPQPPGASTRHGAVYSPPPAQQPWSAQLRTLCRRYIAVIAADRTYAAFLLAMPLVLGLVARMLPGDAGLSVGFPSAIPEDVYQPSKMLLVLVVAGAFAGFAASFREFVKERPIYRRERAIGLSRTAYLVSKLLVLSVVCALQAVAVAVVGMVGVNPPDDALVLGSASAEVTVAVVAVTLSMMALGLLVSALINNLDHGMPLLVVVLMIALVVSGGIFSVHTQTALNAFSWLVPSRWGLAMGAATVNVKPTPGAGPVDPLWEHSAANWFLGLAALATLTLLFVLLTSMLLRRVEPRQPRRSVIHPTVGALATGRPRRRPAGG